MEKQPKVVLRNGVGMPLLGFGTYQLQGPETSEAVLRALEQGYRLIDTAAMYQNEEDVGRAVRESGLKREEVFVTSKVWNSDLGYESTRKAFDSTIKRLGLDYLDLYLIHWPCKPHYIESWQALEYLYEKQLIRAIGVSNFLIHHLESIHSECAVKPMVNQFEFHPFLQQSELVDFCKTHKIQVQAWGPLTRGQHLGHPLLIELGQEYKKSPAQIILRWNIQKGISAIPKSASKERIAENFNVFDFELSLEDIKKIDCLNQNYRLGPHPDNINF
ncbi:MAG: aldo/keto reductase [Spirochaetales bacterium]|nr:aldo/keto reductase [Spirochaetales bacterium]